MSQPITVPCRVDFRVIPTHTLKEQTGRMDVLSANGCTILTHHRPAVGTILELRIALPDGEWPLRVDHAHVTGSQWGAFSADFMSLPPRDKARLHQYVRDAAALQRV